MDYDRAFEYFEAITVIEARETLREMNVSAYPNMKKEEGKKLHRELSKSGYPKELQNPMSFEEFIGKMTNG